MSETEEEIIARQLKCTHGLYEKGFAFVPIAGNRNSRICLHCGITDTRLEELQSAQMAYSSMWHP